MGPIVEDVLIAAEWISQALQPLGYQTDFSPESLYVVEQLFVENVNNGKAIQGGLLDEDLGIRLFALGAYVGEVLRRNLGGDWSGDDSDPQAEINVSLILKPGIMCWPIQRVMKRYLNGPQDSMVDYGRDLGLNLK